MPSSVPGTTRLVTERIHTILRRGCIATLVLRADSLPMISSVPEPAGLVTKMIHVILPRSCIATINGDGVRLFGVVLCGVMLADGEALLAKAVEWRGTIKTV